MGPYTKRRDDGWTIEDGNGKVIARLATNEMADWVMDGLIEGGWSHGGMYAEGKPYGGEKACRKCRQVFRVNEAGVAYHIGEEGKVDWEMDIDHVVVPE